MTTTTRTATLGNGIESARITEIVQDAADQAFQARTRTSMVKHLHPSAAQGAYDMTKRLEVAGISVARATELAQSTRNAGSPAEFQAFARALGVSPRWLAIGEGTPAQKAWEAPAGWSGFGAHVGRPDVQLEFSDETDEDGMPLWERVVEGQPEPVAA